MSPCRYWPAGAPCPQQVLVLFELLRFDDEKSSTDPCMEDFKPATEKNGIKPTESVPNCMHDMNDIKPMISTTDCMDDIKPTSERNGIKPTGNSPNCIDDISGFNP
jgi:hypothetical protein